jgi:hypothetical protein
MIDLRKKPDLSSVASDLKALTTASKTLNELTDKLTEQVAQIESVVNTLNLGLRVSVIVSSYGDDNEPWINYKKRLSYSKNDGKWGFEVEEFEDDDNDPGRYRNHASWAFKDAPRSLRLEVVHKIPELIKAMVQECERVADEINEKLDDAIAIAASLSAPVVLKPVRQIVLKPVGK